MATKTHSRGLLCAGLVSLALAACSNSDFPSDGFKTTKFGMSTSQLEAIGFTCEANKKKCSKKLNTKKDAAESETLFGKPADIDADLADDKVTSINVHVGVEEKELVELFTKAVGSPKTFDYVSIFGDKIRLYYWVTSGGTSISITINLDEKPAEGIFKMIGPRATAVYRSKQETTDLLDKIKKSAVKPKDY